MTTLANWGVGSAGADLLAQLPTTPVVSDEAMLENARSSLSRGLSVIQPYPPHDTLLSVAGGGPSLEDTWKDLDGAVAAVNGSLGFLIEKGIIPWACSVMDPGPHMKDIVPRVEGVKYFIGSICDPSLFDHLEGLEVGIWHPGGVPGLKEMLEARGPNWTMVAGGSTTGSRWLTLGYTLGFRRFHFHGMDSSYREDRTHAYPDHTDGADHLLGNGYRTKLAFVRQVHDFFTMLDVFANDPAIEPVGIEMFGDGWMQDRWKVFRELHPDAFVLKPHTEDSECTKYERMWEHDVYRGNSPGESLAPHIVDLLGMKPGDSVTDFGCGPGRATQWFADQGYEARGIDIARNSLDEGMTVPVRVACLWDLPADIEESDWGVCCDVMEHIPPDRVDAVLRNIAAKVRNGVAFNIAFRQDLFGRLVGEPLHLTIRPASWWADKLGEYWSDVEIVEADQVRGLFTAC